MYRFNNVCFQVTTRNEFHSCDLRSGRFIVYAADGRVSQHRDGKVAQRAAERAIASGRESVIVYEVA